MFDMKRVGFTPFGVYDLVFDCMRSFRDDGLVSVVLCTGVLMSPLSWLILLTDELDEYLVDRYGERVEAGVPRLQYRVVDLVSARVKTVVGGRD